MGGGGGEVRREGWRKWLREGEIDREGEVSGTVREDEARAEYQRGKLQIRSPDPICRKRFNM